MSRNVKHLSRSVKRSGADKYKYAHGRLMRWRAGAGLSGSQHRYIDQFIFDRLRRSLNQHRSKSLCRGRKAMSLSVAANVVSKGEIFVIDDDATTREMLSSTLEKNGYDVVSFADGP
jgi:hypothetical protein